MYTCQSGKNHERQFYWCPRNRSKKDCKYFKWVDELNDTTIDMAYGESLAFQEMVNKNFEELKYLIKVLIAVDVSIVIILLVLLIWLGGFEDVMYFKYEVL